MKNWIALVLLMWIISPVAIAGNSGNVEEGKETFAKRCAICHGKDGSGNGPAAKALGGAIPSLASKEAQAMTDAAIQKVITEGKGKMKPVKNLSKGDLTNLIAFIRSLAKK